MKNRDSFLLEYAPVLGLVLLMVFIFVYSTLPSIRMNSYLNRVRQRRIVEIDTIKEGEARLLRLQKALESDPLTVENELRRLFGGATREGEVEIDRLAR